MKIGIISDIHGDYAALTTALDRLDNYHQADHILCAGDLVGRGPDQDSVVRHIRERDIPTVLGNHDEWNYKLAPENKTFLKELPIEWRGKIGGCRLYMCHGKPGNNLWGLYRDHASDTLLNMMLASLRVDVLIAGHTHVPMFIRVKRGCVVNPGSLYTFNNMRSTSHTYGVLNLPGCDFEIFDVATDIIEPLPLAGT